MRITFKKQVPHILIFLCGILIGIFLGQNKSTWEFIKKPIIKPYIKFDDTRNSKWSNDFELIEISSSIDNNIQKAYFYKAKSNNPRPLVVSLHTWSGNFRQNDPLAEHSKNNNINYIHPDFRGPNKTMEACCSELVISDIDESISFAIENTNVDTSKIYIIGASGGGYATLCTFMKSKHKIRKFSAWVPLTNLIAGYNESMIRQNKYAKDILDCTESENGILNIEVAKKKSPIYWNTPSEKLIGSELKIYAGINDGIQGSVPITHSINFYNKLLTDLAVSDSSLYVSDKEKLRLLEYRKPLGNFGKISNRNICLIKKYKNIQLIIFEGGHEMLTEYAFNELIE